MKRKKIIGVGYLGAAVIIICSGFITLSYGSVTLGVTSTKHNLGSTGVGVFKADIESEVCVFCHTPHNSAAGQNFLWNRQADVNSATVFYLYSSPWLTAAAKGAAISDVSKMCMSCHDGVTALNSMANPRLGMGGPVGVGDALSTWVWWGEDVGEGPQWGPNIGEGDVVGLPLGASGGNLRNDHPISFSYTAAALEDTALKSIDNARTEGLVFWGPNSDQIECVTCHDPHILSNKKFLRRSNGSSNLCFACHNK